METTTVAGELCAVPRKPGSGSDWSESGSLMLADGRRVTLRVGQDECFSIMDEDPIVFGRLEWVSRSRTWGYDAERPQGFDGGAYKLHFGRSGEPIWWQPPADFVGDVDKLRRTVVRLLEEGYSFVRVDVDEKCACCGQWKNVGAASLGGVDLGDWREVDANLVEVVGELLAEVGIG